MLLEYWEHTGDIKILRRYYFDCRTILEAFRRCIDTNTGLLGATGFWDFVDWQSAWNENSGQPGALKKGPSTVMSLMLACALEDTARIGELAGFQAEAKEYRVQKETLLQAVRKYCFDGIRGMFREGPSYPEFYQGTQSWAVLAGAISGNEAVTALRNSVESEDVLKCTFSTSFEFFRACEKTGCYELTERQLQLFIDLTEEHCTTVPETPVHSRSECHGWSALPIYELFHCYAGMHQVPGEPGKYTVMPWLGRLDNLFGSFPTSRGLIHFSASREKGKVSISLEVPEGIKVIEEGTGEKKKMT
ncbi:MAG TPA: hypothetical protein PLN48_14730 [Lachnospiraceae bacterium]|nr:hypothetical protein [Lachnospiraceae bacterium]